MSYFGSIPVNQVRGDFRITGKGFGYRDRLHVPFESLNFSHVIQEFSFGEFYPYLNNPLDATGRLLKKDCKPICIMQKWFLLCMSNWD